MTIKERYDELVQSVDRAKEKRTFNEEVTIVAVTKTVEVDRIMESINAGVKNIGENKVQELLRKAPEVEGQADLHLIGSLQTNKVKDVLDKTKLIHSLDRMSLLKELEKRGEQKKIVSHCLIQLNVSKEDSKAGMYEEALDDFLKEVEKCHWVKVEGLMTIAPYDENPENIRWVFKKMREIFEYIKNIDYNNVDMRILSMGMSNDYKVAIEEGATMIRVGSLIFGERNYGDGGQ